MLDYSEAKRFIADLPWPLPRMRPLLAIDVCEGGRVRVRLYDSKYKRVVTATAPAPESALRGALTTWMGPLPGLALSPAELDVLAARLRHLVN